MDANLYIDGPNGAPPPGEGDTSSSTLRDQNGPFKKAFDEWFRKVVVGSEATRIVPIKQAFE